MKKTSYDSSAIDNYVHELNNRQSEVTRSMKTENLKRAVPSRILLFCGYLLPIIFLICALGFAFQKALSITTENITTINTKDNTHQPGNNVQDNKDILINVDDILNRDSILPVSNNLSSNTVRDYYIYDITTLEVGPIKEVTVGRRYDSPGSEPSYTWCYVQGQNTKDLRTAVDLIAIRDNKRIETDLTMEIANGFGVTIKDLKRAKASCSI